MFTINGALYNLSSITCDLPPQSAVKEVGHCNTVNVVKGSIGFNLEDEFLELIEVCYDTVKQITVHARHILNKNIVNEESGVDRKKNILLELFETPNQFYICKNQIASLAKLLISQIHAERYITCNKEGDAFLTKAHLVPKSDLLFEFQKKTSSYDINTAPMWQTINTGNWRILENRIRRYANSHKADLTIITGTMNVMTLPNLFGMHQDLYLTNGEKSKAVPALFWKLVHDRITNAGIVFLLVNNPYHQNLQARGYIVCDCVCGKAKSWFDGWNRFDRRKGYVYCCTIDDFQLKTGMKSFFFRVRNLLR